MAKAHEGLEVKDITEPNGIIRAEVCKDSGNLPTNLCMHIQEVIEFMKRCLLKEQNRLVTVMHMFFQI